MGSKTPRDIIIVLKKGRMVPILESLGWDLLPRGGEKPDIFEIAARRNALKEVYKEYEPVIETLQKYGPSTLEQISGYTGRPYGEDKGYLELLLMIDVVKKEDGIYRLAADVKEVLSLFDVDGSSVMILP